MFINSDLYISERFTKHHYFKLKLKLNSSPDDWEMAVAILKDRINGRYLGPINGLLAHADKNGFAAMSLMCLLIDTFLQFKHGYFASDDENGAKYISFLHNSLGFDEELSHHFYYDIRCGLLHSAETKYGSYLVRQEIPNNLENNSPLVIMQDEPGYFVLVASVRGMYNVLKDYFKDYWNKLLDPMNEDLRSNFIAKMDFITMKKASFKKASVLWNGICEYAGKELTASSNRVFKYEKDYTKVALVIHRLRAFEFEDIIIPFSNIRDVARYGDIENANRRRGEFNQIENSAYIKAILDCFPDKVKQYREDLKKDEHRRFNYMDNVR